MSDNCGEEIEIKLRMRDAASAQARLEQAGFTLLHARAHEDNLIFDTADSAIRGAGKLLRLRRARDRSVLTYKGPAAGGKHKQREEIETDVADFAHFQLILERLGYVITFRYEKFRSEYSRAGEAAGVVTIDETPIGVFLELEGPAVWIDATAAVLGFTEADYITSSYGFLFFQHREEMGGTGRDMVF
jgi:adenylate cyclase class 2